MFTNISYVGPVWPGAAGLTVLSDGRLLPQLPLGPAGGGQQGGGAGPRHLRVRLPRRGGRRPRSLRPGRQRRQGLRGGRQQRPFLQVKTSLSTVTFVFVYVFC